MINSLAHEVAAELAGRHALLREAAARALAYLGGLADRPVAPAAAAVAALDRLDFALPGAGQDAASVLALLDDYGSPGTVASGGPRYFGFVTGGALPIAQAAAWLTTAWDQNAALPVMSPAAAVLNRVALRWVTELLRCAQMAEHDLRLWDRAGRRSAGAAFGDGGDRRLPSRGRASPDPTTLKVSPRPTSTLKRTHAPHAAVVPARTGR